MDALSDEGGLSAAERRVDRPVPMITSGDKGPNSVKAFFTIGGFRHGQGNQELQKAWYRLAAVNGAMDTLPEEEMNALVEPEWTKQIRAPKRHIDTGGGWSLIDMWENFVGEYDKRTEDDPNAGLKVIELTAKVDGHYQEEKRPGRSEGEVRVEDYDTSNDPHGSWLRRYAVITNEGGEFQFSGNPTVEYFYDETIRPFMGRVQQGYESNDFSGFKDSERTALEAVQEMITAWEKNHPGAKFFEPTVAQV